MSAEPTPREQLAKLLTYTRGFRATYLVSAGLKLGLFIRIKENPGPTTESLATALGLHLPYVSVWCRTAVALGFLEADEAGHLTLAPAFDQILADPASPWYYGGAVGLLVDYEADDLARHPAFFKSGEAHPFQSHGRAFSEQVGVATAGLHTLMARRALPGLPGMEERLHRGLRALDVGCGCGGFLLALAQAFPGGRYTGVDVDRRALASARKAIKARGLSRRVRVKAAGADGFPVKGPFDLITLVQVLHEIQPEVRATVLGECARHLARDGWLVILDETYPSSWAELRQPENWRPILTAYTELTWGNVLPTRLDQETLLADAGFVVRDRGVVGDGFTLLTAQKNT
jgi:ubiquinone/menaquinone biosynthesis C-methylase UbiE